MVSTSYVTVMFFVFLQTVLLSTISNCAKTISMYWNTTNSIFRIDNTDHIIDVNKNNAEFEFDQVNIICPVYQPGTFDDEAEKYIIYNVSKEEYETCRITTLSPRVIAICDKPSKTMYFTITFRPYTPQPGGLEFLPGHDYYFISTSSKDDLHRHIGGRCTTNNMKVVFKVCCKHESSTTLQNNGVALSTTTTSTSVSTTPMFSAGDDRMHPGVFTEDEHLYSEDIYSPHSHDPPDTIHPTHPQVPSSVMYPPHSHQSPADSGSSFQSTISNTQQKKSKEYSDHSNEVVKNEELTYNGSSAYKRRIQEAQVFLLVSMLVIIKLSNWVR